MEYELHIRSMHCPNCAANIQRYLRNQPGVETAEIDFESEIGLVVVEPSVDIDRLISAIDTMGYDVSHVDGDRS